MPKMRGPALAERLRARHPALQTLYISGYAERETLQALGENAHFLAKPFLPGDLFRVAREILEGREQGPAERAG
jgi:DNA-binding NtrC family response regulator